MKSATWEDPRFTFLHPKVPTEFPPDVHWIIRIHSFLTFRNKPTSASSPNLYPCHLHLCDKRLTHDENMRVSESSHVKLRKTWRLLDPQHEGITFLRTVGNQQHGVTSQKALILLSNSAVRTPHHAQTKSVRLDMEWWTESWLSRHSACIVANVNSHSTMTTSIAFPRIFQFIF